ncbi:Uncharacterised protein [Mycobacteroides abscessus subsp. massiliense]|nr:Uncharacterised protein [Mycobacteroides abscessus subsp. massiliense]SKR69118.1 Uncharacterised protein [Mycobacteroides abscessus subsp. massiliense]SKT54607.1 Uncharacterised protein [Mycobacteroides abscessus subsp. massiliense]SKT90500.1 Uncharacterised protein [Mycobacteroides abscessus subsp. massiliense]SLA35730.1 Uncharacterised protein [Mycobacteroides abscessus subsp. massiliense]
MSGRSLAGLVHRQSFAQKLLILNNEIQSYGSQILRSIPRTLQQVRQSDATLLFVPDSLL